MTNIVKAALVAGAIAAAGLGFAGHASADNSDSIVGRKVTTTPLPTPPNSRSMG